MSDREFLLHVFKGDADAVALTLLISRVADVWDNLVDKDKVVTEDDINEVFYAALVQIPENPFYQRFGAELRPVMVTGILNWMAATAIERGKPTREQLHISHVIRYSIADVMLMMATLIGGPAWGSQVAADIRLRAQKNKFREYAKEHASE